MLCEKCKKNQAVSRLEHKINGEVKEMVLCKSCLNAVYDTAFKGTEMLFDIDKQTGAVTSLLFNMGVSHPQAVAAIFDDMMGIQNTQKAVEKIVCKECGTDIRDFRKTLFVGCPHCYTAFSSSLIPILKQVQGVSTHKTPENKAFMSQQDTLIKELERAITEERFEDAVTLSAKLKKLREGNNNL